MYINAAKEYLKEIKPTLEEAGRTGKDLAVKDFDCSFDASLECSIKNGSFEMIVDYTGDLVICFNLKDEMNLHVTLTKLYWILKISMTSS